MSLKSRLAKLEHQLTPVSLIMPEGLKPMEQYIFMINNTQYRAKNISAGNVLTPQQAYWSLIGKAS